MAFAQKKRKPVQTGLHSFMGFAQKKHKPVQTGSHRFMAFAQKKHKPVQTGSDRFMDISPRECHNNVKTQSGANRFTPIHGFCSKKTSTG